MKSFFFLLIPAVVLIRLGFPPFNLAPLTLAGWAIMLSYILSESRTMSRALGGAWLAGFIWNLSMTVYVAFPHWATSIGWVALSAYLAVYWLVFAWGCRLALQKKIPMWFAAPILWAGLELIQGHLLSGFLLNQQAIAFYKAPVLLQLAEYCGSYVVSFILMLLSALVYHAWKNYSEGRKPFLALLSIFLVVGLVAGIGIFILNETNDKLAIDNNQNDGEFTLISGGESVPSLNIALIQGNTPCLVDCKPEHIEERFSRYCAKTFDALNSSPRPDIIVWPEGMFRFPRIEISDKEPVPDPNFKGTKEQYLETVRRNSEMFQPMIGAWAKNFEAGFITGIDRCVLSGEDRLIYNSVVAVDSYGRDIGQYDKRHLVLFGEYIPFSDQIPILKQITPVGGGMQSGKKVVLPLTFQKENGTNAIIAKTEESDVSGNDNSDWTFLPSVCYENTLPHVIGNQVRMAKQPVDALLNLSNDGWFKGCFENELRLAQSVFRAIETRKTHIVCCNGGISAHIDSTGHILQHGDRETPSFWGGTVKNEYIPILLKKNGLRNYITTYTQYGDAFSGCCLFLSLTLLFNPLVRPLKSSKSESKEGKIDNLEKK